jgi:hypothetical protein
MLGGAGFRVAKSCLHNELSNLLKNGTGGNARAI